MTTTATTTTASIMPTLDVSKRKKSIFHRWRTTLAPWLPTRLKNVKPTILYSSEVHGVSLRTLYRLCDEAEPLLIIIQSMNNEVFGAFLSTNLKERFGPKGRNRRFFGTGETFLYQLSPLPRRFPWMGLDEETKLPPDGSLFISADNDNLVVGGGGGEGLQLDDALFRGRSQSCRTFANEPLALGGRGGGGGGGLAACRCVDGDAGGDFIVKTIEVVGFEDNNRSWNERVFIDASTKVNEIVSSNPTFC